MWETAAQMKWEAEIIIFLSEVLLGTYWITSFKYNQKKEMQFQLSSSSEWVVG